MYYITYEWYSFKWKRAGHRRQSTLWLCIDKIYRSAKYQYQHEIANNRIAWDFPEVGNGDNEKPI